MRGLKSTAALLLVLLGLVGYIYFIDSERPEPGSEPSEQAFDVSPENIDDVRLTNAAGETAHVQRIDTSWQLVEPEPADADATAVAAITSGLASLEVQRVVDDAPTDLTQFGLDPPRFDVTFRVSDQEDAHRVLIGEATPTGGDIYAKLGAEDRVFLISSVLDGTFDKTAFDLRDKAALKFDRNSADALEVEGLATLAFERDGTSWRIVRPIAARADYASVEGLMTRLSAAQMQRIVAEDATDLAPYGLNAPSATVTVVSGSSRASLLIGGTDPEAQLFAKDASRRTIFTLEQSLSAELQKEISEFRNKDVFDARSFTASRVELRRADATRIFEKATAEDGTEAWRTAAGEDVDGEKMEELLSGLTGLRAASFESAAHPSLAAPALTAVVGFDDKTETVTFGRDEDDVYASREDEPGSVMLESGAFDDVLTTLDELE